MKIRDETPGPDIDNFRLVVVIFSDNFGRCARQVKLARARGVHNVCGVPTASFFQSKFFKDKLES